MLDRAAVLAALGLLPACSGGPVLSVDRSGLEFPATPAGRAAEASLDLRLDSGGPATLAWDLLPADAPFAPLGPLPAVLATRGSAALTVRFQPESDGLQAAQLRIVASSVLGESQLVVVLSGRAVATLGVDGDRDGFLPPEDCDDADPFVYPGAPEICDAKDDDCDGTLPLDESDFDGDGATLCGGDCADDDPSVSPLLFESCNGVDDDCDGASGDGEADADGDGHRPCDDDCDDNEPEVHGGAADDCWDLLDNDCDGIVNGGCDCPIFAATEAPDFCSPPGTYACPIGSVQDAVDVADQRNCSIVYLEPGTYEERLVIEYADLLLRPRPDTSGLVAIDALGKGRVVDVEPGAVVQIAEIGITGGEAADGGGIRVMGATLTLDAVQIVGNACTPGGRGGGLFAEDSSVDVVGSLFVDNQCGWSLGDGGNDGGAAYLLGGTVSISDSTFASNLAGDGSAIWSGSAVQHTFLRDEFRDNDSGDSGGGLGEFDGGTLVLDGDHKDLRNCVFVGNEASAGAGALAVLGAAGSTTIANNVFVGNSAPGGAGIHFGGSLWSYFVLENNVVASNEGWGMYSDSNYFQGDIRWNAVSGNFAGDWGGPLGWAPAPGENLDVDCAFVLADGSDGWGNEDWQLGAGSPCVDAGNPDAAWNDATDGSRSDLGIFGGPYGDWEGP